MRKMKDSGVEWIGKIPESWEIKKLKYTTLLELEKITGENDLMYIGLEHIESRIGKLDKNYEPVYDFNGDTIKFDNNSILFGKLRPYLAKVYYTISEGKCSSEFLVINPIRIYGMYLYYLMLSKGFIDIVDSSTYGVKMPRAEWSFIGNLKIPVPSQNEQKIISDYLKQKCNELDIIIAAKVITNEKLKEYRQSIIYEAVTKGLDKNAPMKDSGIDWIGKIPETWEVKKLKFIGDSIIGITYSPNDITEEGLLVLRSSNVQKGKISYEDNVYVSKEVNEKLLVKKNDILICSRNGSKDLIGKCALIDDEAENSTFGAFMTIFRSEANKYIYYVFNSPIFSFHIGTFLTTTVNQLTISNLNNIIIPIPTKSKEQQQIADYLDKKCAEIDTVISANEKTIEKLKEYRQSIIYEAVTGKTEIV